MYSNVLKINKLSSEWHSGLRHHRVATYTFKHPQEWSENPQTLSPLWEEFDRMSYSDGIV